MNSGNRIWKKKSRVSSGDCREVCGKKETELEWKMNIYRNELKEMERNTTGIEHRQI